jgi:hypothetical protein
MWCHPTLGRCRPSCDCPLADAGHRHGVRHRVQASGEHTLAWAHLYVFHPLQGTGRRLTGVCSTHAHAPRHSGAFHTPRGADRHRGLSVRSPRSCALSPGTASGATQLVEQLNLCRLHARAYIPRLYDPSVIAARPLSDLRSHPAGCLPSSISAPAVRVHRAAPRRSSACACQTGLV